MVDGRRLKVRYKKSFKKRRGRTGEKSVKLQQVRKSMLTKNYVRNPRGFASG